MKFITYIDKDGADRLGVLTADGAGMHPLADLGIFCSGMTEFIASYDETIVARLRAKIAVPGVPLAEVMLAAPIPYPRHDILCIGQNYLGHAIESAKFRGKEYTKPAYPTYFAKRVNRAVAPEGTIAAHADITAQLDYEVELAVVIGSRCDHVRPEEAFDHIFGYTIVNDISARDLQNRHGGQYTFGKSLDDSTPMGPWLVTRDEFASPPHLRVRTWVNGELRQDGNTSDFIFDIPRLISELSTGIVLEPGDILITGTPAGVAMGFQPPRFIKAGDVVECEVEGIGRLRNTVG